MGIWPLPDIKPVGLQFSFAFSIYLILAKLDPAWLSCLHQKFSAFLWKMYLTFCAVTFHTSGCIHGVAKELKPRTLSSQHTCRYWSRLSAMMGFWVKLQAFLFVTAARLWQKTYVQTNSHGEIACIRTQCHFQPFRNFPHFVHTITSKASHNHGATVQQRWERQAKLSTFAIPLLLVDLLITSWFW